MNVSSQSTIQSLVCKVLFGLFDMFCFGLVYLGLVCSVPVASWLELLLDSAAVSIFVVILFELTNTVFVNSTNISSNNETVVLSYQSHII